MSNKNNQEEQYLPIKWEKAKSVINFIKENPRDTVNRKAFQNIEYEQELTLITRPWSS